MCPRYGQHELMCPNHQIKRYVYPKEIWKEEVARVQKFRLQRYVCLNHFENTNTTQKCSLCLSAHLKIEYISKKVFGRNMCPKAFKDRSMYGPVI